MSWRYATCCNCRPGRFAQFCATSGPGRKTRRPIAADELADLTTIEKKIKTLTKELTEMVQATGSTLTELPGVGAIVAARVLTEVGDVIRFADRNRFASWTGTAPLEASSGEHVRHRLSRAGNRRMNHMIRIAATTQIRLDAPGRATTDASSPPASLGWKRCAASYPSCLIERGSPPAR